MTALADAVAALLDQDAARVADRQSRAYDERAGAFGDAVVLVGAGALGRLALAGLRRAGTEPLAFADNAPERQGTRVDGVAVLAVPDAVARLGAGATFVVTVYNASGPTAQLRALGCPRVVAFPHLFARHRAAMLPHVCLDAPDALFAQADAARAALELFADERSRREYVAQLRHRLFLDFDDPTPLASREPEYFPPGVYLRRDDECLVDCGAFDGDTTRRFVAEWRGRFARVVAIEGDPATYARLRANVAAMPPDVAARVTTVCAAVGARAGRVRFAADGSVTSRLADAGGVEVDCVTLDAVLADATPTLVKMDVEGAELDALAGARATVARCGPVLAVSVYHAQDHLWRIPATLRALAPGHRLFLRAHAEACWDVCCYAVPAARVAHQG